MISKVFSIIFYVIAGFFVYVGTLLTFADFQDEPVIKWIALAIEAVPFLLFMLIGLAISRFRRWRRDLGVVLLSGAGFTAFIAFTMTCFLMSDEFRKMMPPDTPDFSYTYGTGVVFLLSIAAIGILLIKSDRNRVGGEE